MMRVDFGGPKLRGKTGAPIFTGRLEGQVARLEHELDKADRNKIPVIVNIPDDTGVTASFFLGMFRESIINAGSREAFLNQYTFQCSYLLSESTIGPGIDRALYEARTTENRTSGPIRRDQKRKQGRRERILLGGVCLFSLLMIIYTFFFWH